MKSRWREQWQQKRSKSESWDNMSATAYLFCSADAYQHHLPAYTASSPAGTKYVHVNKAGEEYLPVRKLINLVKIAEIERMGDNWNGYGAEPLPHDVIRRAEEFVLRLPEDAFVSPTARDSIQIEFEKRNGDYFEIELFTDHFSVYVVRGDHESEHDYPYEELHIKRLTEEVEGFCG